MVIIQNGFLCENEMNIFARLFFSPDEDVFISVNLEYENKTACAYTTVIFENRTYFGETVIQCIWDDDDLERKTKICACTRSMCEAAEKIRRVSLPWGVMSGIRPAKSARGLFDKGFDKDGVCSVFRHIYDVSDKKARLAAEVAENEAGIIKNIDKSSVGIYIGIPFCPTRCLYCSFVSADMRVSGRYMEEFVNKLLIEIEKTGDIMNRLDMHADSVYIGGGTPTTLSAADISRVMGRLRECIDLSRLREFTIEAGRPDTITAEKLEAAINGGADRISINPQSMNMRTLEAIGRAHTPEMIKSAYGAARNAGFKTINMDLIAGLPGESPEMFASSLDEVAAMRPENITVHSMCIKRAARLDYSREQLTRASEMNEMLDHAQQTLRSCGYKPYYMYRQKNISGNLENVGYSLEGHMSGYNVNIMEEVQTIIALGGGGSTKIVTGDKITRIFNFKDPAEYIRRFDDILNRKEEIVKIMG